MDCLTNIRLLRNLRPPVSVYFDKERLDSLDEKAEVFLTMLASFAQEESRSISTNIKWATRSRMKAGTQKISTTSLLGYDTDDDGEMVIVTNEAEIVRTIYMSFDKGMHPAEIAEKLNALEIRTIKNNPWTGESVKNILRNEKYCGDVLMQKTYTVDCLTHKTKKNEGEVEQYFIYNFEMHIELYHKIYDTFNEKYADVKQRLIPDAEVPYRFHFTPEDFYVFVIAHAYKHYSRSGTGIRTLADIYIMNQNLGGTLNWEYVDSELRGLGIFSYEHESRELAQKIFGIAELPTKANLSEAEQQMLAYYLGASTYGTIENRILNQMQKLQPDDGAFTARTKRKYLLSRIFPGREWCKAYAPTVYKYPVLLPFFWVWRLIYKGITNRKKVTQEIKTIKAGKQN